MPRAYPVTVAPFLVRLHGAALGSRMGPFWSPSIEDQQDDLVVDIPCRDAGEAYDVLAFVDADLCVEDLHWCHEGVARAWLRMTTEENARLWVGVIYCFGAIPGAPRDPVAKVRRPLLVYGVDEL